MKTSLALCLAAAAAAQTAADYSKAPSIFPHIFQPYSAPRIPLPNFSNAENPPLEVHDGKLRLSMDQLVRLVIENNLTIAAARYYPSMAQTDLLRARSGSSPRGVDVSTIPSGVFAGAEGGSILGTAGGSGGGSSNPGGITGSAGAVNIRPSGVFDPTLRFSFSVDHTDSPLNTEVVAGLPAVTTGTGAFSVSYVQAFSSGTSFSVQYAVDRQGSTQRHLLYDPDFTPGFTATISQQLANGFGFAVNRALIYVARNEEKIERASFRQQAMAALVSAQDAYWDLVADQGAVRSAEEALAVAQQLERESRKQLEIGTMAPLDVVSAQSQVAGSQRDLIVAQTTVQNAELALKALISKNLDEPLASATIETLDPLPEPDDTEIPDVDAAKAIAMQNRPELSIAEGNLKSEMDAMPFIRNALLPSVNVFGLITTVGLYDVFGTSMVDAIHFKYPEVAFGLSVSFPIRNRQAQADEVRTRLELKQAQDTLVRSKSQVEVDVENAVIALKQSKAQVAAAQETVRLNQRRLDAEQIKLNAGLSTSYNVILVQRDLFASQLADLQARDAFAKARVTLAQATGSVLDADHITLDEALRGRLGAPPTP
ncbi:MAG TPA: TolC family protein [Bryobacteraceae bacterium]|nr:TolC family protein [Bryobacteraceae bacterium]